MQSVRRILHFADLHLVNTTEFRDYSLAVFRETLAIARSEAVDLLIGAGDLFDSRRDFEAMLSEVDSLLESSLPGVPLLLVPGNHEELLRSQGPLKALPSTKNVRIARELPLGLHHFDSCEVVTVPFQTDYAGFDEWELPPKKSGLRVVVAHGSVLGSVPGPESAEERDGVLDGEIFSRLRADYIALGHIHQGGELSHEGVPLVYPGSSRVWRQGEVGPRRVAILELSDTIHYSFRTIESAGQVRRLGVVLDSSAEERVREAAEGWGPQDWAHLIYQGLVPDGDYPEKVAASHTAFLKDRVRRVSIDPTALLVVPDAQDSQLVQRFLEEWEELRSTYQGTENQEAWEEARLIGLERIARALS
jgi:DNA repair exonuclease SbcCD nuclease subunit